MFVIIVIFFSFLSIQNISHILHKHIYIYTRTILFTNTAFTLIAGNTLSSVAGIIGPLVVAQLTSAVPGPWGWRLSFILCGLLCVVSSVLWRLFQTSSIVSALNTPKDL